MLKLDMGIWSVKLSKFEKIFFHFLLLISLQFENCVGEFWRMPRNLN